jgi:hypothetical protein
MSYILVSEGKPPFVLTVENAAAYFDPSSVIRDTAKKARLQCIDFQASRSDSQSFLRINLTRTICSHRIRPKCALEPSNRALGSRSTTSP